MTITYAEKRERLEQVIRVVEELPKDKKFALKNWGKCGTVGCAIGWCGLDSWFTRRGFFCYKMVDGSLIPSMDGRDGYSAVVDFFEISFERARTLFDGDDEGEEGKQLVIRRIREFLEKSTS